MNTDKAVTSRTFALALVLHVGVGAQAPVSDPGRLYRQIGDVEDKQ